MKPTFQIVVALVLAAWAASLAQADARQRGAKHAPNAARQVTQPHRPAPAPAFTPRNAIGATTPPARIAAPVTGAGTVPGTGATGGVKFNATAVRPGSVGSLPAAPVGAAKIGPTAGPTTFVRSASPALASHGGGISGTGMTRPGTAPGMLGGPAKLTGGITGTGMRRRAQ
jgi:hypothetical protein